MYGVWLPPILLRTVPIPIQREQFARIERLGYSSLWTGEAPPDSPVAGRDVFAQQAVMLAATERIVIGAGVANIRARHPVTMHGGASTLAEAYPDRFVLGLGGAGGPSELGRYLDAMDDAAGRLPGTPYRRVLAALGPRMHELARDRADGVHAFQQPVEHTAIARAALAPGQLLVVHQAVALETDPDAARALPRAGLRFTTGENPYTRNYRRLGFTDADLAGDRSDRLIDATLAWGDRDSVVARLRAHLDAGADQVLVQPYGRDLPSIVDQLRMLALAG
jgi:probable F420-dependent oxidoreductase